MSLSEDLFFASFEKSPFKHTSIELELDSLTQKKLPV